MWNRANLKASAKVAFKRNYWICVVVALILGIASGTASGSAGSQVGQNTETIISGETTPDTVTPDDILNEILPSGGTVGIAIATLLIVVIIIILIIALAFQFFFVWTFRDRMPQFL